MTDWDYVDRMQAALPQLLFNGIGVAMHRRDFLAKYHAKDEFLGVDTLAQELFAEFNALSDPEKAALEKKPGKFGVFALADTTEVELGLKIVAKEKFPEYRLEEYEMADLTNPEIVEKISERFPEITPVRIQNALVLG